MNSFKRQLNFLIYNFLGVWGVSPNRFPRRGKPIPPGSGGRYWARHWFQRQSLRQNFVGVLGVAPNPIYTQNCRLYKRRQHKKTFYLQLSKSCSTSSLVLRLRNEKGLVSDFSISSTPLSFSPSSTKSLPYP